jgi:hypothetical protein
VETTYTGYLKDRRTGAALSASPVVYNRRCSGVVVSSSGYVATTGRCVAPPADALRQAALFSLGQTMINDKKLDAAGLQKFVSDNMRTATYTGLAEGSEPDAQLRVQLGIPIAGATTSPAIAASVAVVQKNDEGNVAILKVDQANLPTLELDAEGSLAQGTKVLLLGFNLASGGAFTPRSASVQVIGTGSKGTTNWRRLDGDVGPDSAGGPGVATNGHLVGLIDSDPAMTTTPNRALLDIASISAAMSQAGAANSLSESDKAYRRGLDSYFSGRYSAAIADFERVQRDQPSNKVAGNYRQAALDRMNIEQEPASLPVWLIPAVVALVAAVLGGLIVALVLRRRARRRERDETEILVPVSLNPFAPVSGIPTSGGMMFPSADQPTGYAPGDLPVPQPGVAIPHAAPSGVPIPYPPKVEPARDATAPAEPVDPADAEAPPAAPPSPAPAPAPQQRTAPPDFAWPADDDNTSPQPRSDSGWGPPTSSRASAAYLSGRDQRKPFTVSPVNPAR